MALTLTPALRSRQPVVTASNLPIPIDYRATNTGTSDGRPADAGNNIVLGDITTVPFQELYGLLSTLSPEQRMQLAQQLKNLPPGKETTAKIAIFFKTWAQLDAKAAMTAALSFKTLETMTAAINSVIEGADATTAAALALSINEMPPGALSLGQKSDFLGKAVTKWGQVDPTAAAKFLDSIGSDGPNFIGAWRSVAENWAAFDPAAALAWIDGHIDAKNTKFVVSAAVRAYYENDPRAAEAYVSSHVDQPGHQQLASLIADRIWKDDPQRAKDWVSQLSNVDARRYGNHSIAMQVASTDPQAASEWAASLSEAERGFVINAAVGAWARKDPQAAAQWLSGLTGTVRDEAISSYSIRVAAQDPTAALTWASSVSDPATREMSVQRIVVSWAKRNPGEAKAWIQKSSLTDVQKTHLTNSLRSR
ncbi:MAG: hypothetical protein V7609_3004 [Verrucomicrobiota bacterium]